MHSGAVYILHTIYSALQEVQQVCITTLTLKPVIPVRSLLHVSFRFSGMFHIVRVQHTLFVSQYFVSVAQVTCRQIRNTWAVYLWVERAKWSRIFLMIIHIASYC